MKKSKLSLFLVLVLVAVFAFAACSQPAAPAADEPAADEPAAEEPAADEPAAEEPAADEPAEEEPAADEPAADEPAAAEGDVTIGMSIPQLANPYFVSVMNGVQAKCDELGYTLTVVDAGYDVAKQVSDFENFGNQGVTAVIACPIDSNALLPVVDQLHEKDIMVISFAQIIDNADAILTLDEYTYGVAIGENAAKWINEELDGEAEVLIISQDNVEAVVERGNGIQDTIEKECPNAKVVGRQAGDNPEKGMQIAEDYLQQYPNLNVITGNNDAGPLGAYEAVKAAGRADEKFYVGGGDATPEAIEKMKEDGSVYRATVDLGPYSTGLDAVEFVKQFLAEGIPDEAPVSYFRMDPVWQADVLAGWTPEGSEE